MTRNELTESIDYRTDEQHLDALFAQSTGKPRTYKKQGLNYSLWRTKTVGVDLFFTRDIYEPDSLTS